MSVEQRTVIKFCVLNGKKNRTKKYGNVGECCMKRKALHQWYSPYKSGYKSVMDEQRSGRPTSITSQKVQKIEELLDKER